MILASLAFTVMVSLAKLAREELGPFEIVAWRGLVSAPLAVWLAGGVVGRVRRVPLLALRALLGFGAVSCFFTAAKGLMLADLTIVTRLQPVAVALLAPVVLGSGERAGWRILVAIALGLGGLAVLLKPSLEVGSVFGVFALCGALLSAGAHLSVRSLGRDHEPSTIVFWFQLASVVLGFAGVGVMEQGVSLPPLHLVPHLIGVGVAATAGQVLMTRAYQEDTAPVVAAASYVGPLWAVIGDLVLFSVLPSMSVVVGGALVVGAGVLLLGRPKGVSSGEGGAHDFESRADTDVPQ